MTLPTDGRMSHQNTTQAAKALPKSECTIELQSGHKIVSWVACSPSKFGRKTHNPGEPSCMQAYAGGINLQEGTAAHQAAYASLCDCHCVCGCSAAACLFSCASSQLLALDGSSDPRHPFPLGSLSCRTFSNVVQGVPCLQTLWPLVAVGS